MKKILLLSLVLFAINMLAAQSDEQLIWQTIEAESKAYHTSPDRKLFSSYWHIGKDTRLVYSGLTDRGIFSGSDMQKAVEANSFPPPDQAENVYSNVVVRASGTVGWASFDQKSTLPDGKVSTMHEFRMLEKLDGQWKFIGSSIHEYKD